MKWFKVQYENQSGEVSLFAANFFELADRLRGSNVLKIEFVSDLPKELITEGRIIYRINSGRQYLYRIYTVNRTYGYVKAFGLYRVCSCSISFDELVQKWKVVYFHL